jgi:hypothetical protein
VSNRFAVWLVALVAVAPASGQPGVVSLKPPFGIANGLVSPDGAYVLFGSDTAPQLWLEDKGTHERRKVFDATVQTLTLAWSPDSAAFIANDHAFSDVENSYIYDLKTLRRIDLRSRILAVDPEAADLAANRSGSPHLYFHAIRWLDARHVEVQLCGHAGGMSDTTTTIPPAECFDLRYRADTDGLLKKVSWRIFSLNSKECEGF